MNIKIVDHESINTFALYVTSVEFSFELDFKYNELNKFDVLRKVISFIENLSKRNL